MSLELLLKGAFARFGYQVQQTPLPIRDKDPRFNRIMDEIAGLTLLDPARCFMLYQFALQVRDLQGDAVEVGVYRGGTAKLLGRALEGAGKTLHLFDTFAGMPPTDRDKDLHKEKDFSDSSLELVQANLRGIEGVRFHAGVFPETAKGIGDLTLALAHIDVDIHKSIWDTFHRQF